MNRRMKEIDRHKIEALYNAGHTYRSIAANLGYAVSSVYKEVQHGLYPHMGAELSRRPFRYSAQIAQDYADAQATSKGVEIKLLIDKKNPGVARFGIYDRDGDRQINAALKLLQMGLATFRAGDLLLDEKNAKVFRDAEAAAKKAKIGVWAE